MTNPDREELANLLNVGLLIENGLNEKLARRIGAQWKAKCDELATLRRLASSDSGVKVRELEWASEPTGSEFSADFYYIRRQDGVFYTYLLDAPIATDETAAKAKAAAQADYEARIKSALVKVPAVKGEPEPVAWRYRYNGKWYLSDTKAFAKAGLDVTPLYAATPADAGMREALEDCQTHYDAWRSAITAMFAQGDPDELYWQHELNAFDRTFEALTAPGATTKFDGGERDR